MASPIRFLNRILRTAPPSIFLHRLSTSPPSPSKLGPATLPSEASDLIDEDFFYYDYNGVVSPSVADDVMPSLLLPRVVVYDGVCHLCHRRVKMVIKADKDRKIKFCCVQSKAAEPYMGLCDVDREDVLRRFLFIEGPGLYHHGSTAALKVLSYLPLPYSALSSLLIVPTPLREAVYDYVAKNRYNWFGKDDDCLVLKEKELLERFIDWEELIERGGPDF